MTIYWWAGYGSYGWTATEDEEDISYGVVDPLADTIRYTTLAAVKDRLNITISDNDTALTQAIIAGEIQIDTHLGRSFPDTGTNPEIEGIPIPIKEAATHIAMGVWKAGEAPTGVAGSDGWLSEVDVADQVRREFARNPLLVGYHAGFALA